MLSFPNNTATEKHQPEPKTMGKESALNPQSNQNAQTECKQRAAPQLIIPAHKKHPLHNRMQGV